MNKLNISETVKDLIISEYEKPKMTLRKIAELIGRDRSVIKRIITERNIRIKSSGEQHKRYFVNEKYWEKIDTANKAYFLGWMYSDGCVTMGGNLFRFKLCIQERDAYILNYFVKDLDSSHVIKFEKRKQPHHTDMFNLTVISNKMCQDLINLGCVQRKSLILEFPSYDMVPEHLIHHFIRGVFEGDGSISGFIRRPGTNPQFNFNIVGTKSICEGVNYELSKNLGVKLQSVRTHGKVFTYTLGGNQQIRKLYHYLYDDAELFLTRKKAKMAEVFNIIPYKIQDLV